MDITQRQNLLILWKESFSVVNRAAFSLIAVVVVLGLIMTGVAIGSGVLAKSLLTSGNIAGLIGIGVVNFLFFFGMVFYSMAIFWRILANTTERALFSLSEVFTSSIKPAFYCFIAQILWLIVSSAITFTMNFIGNRIIYSIVYLLLFFGVFIRVVYAFLAIALKNKGPIEGFVHSWKLTGKNYLDTVLMCLLNALFPFVMILFVGICAYSLYVGIPLYFADSFDITHLTWPWFAVLGLIVCGVIFIGVAMFAFPVVVFINRDYTTDDEEDAFIKQDNDLRPLTAENNFQKEPEKLEPVFMDRAPTEDIGPAHIKLSGAKLANRNDQQPVHKNSRDTAEIDLEVLQSSFHVEQNEHVQEKLQEVYQPKKEDEGFIEYAEEDRMPTIVFDETMSRQLEENRKLWQNETKEIDSKHPSDNDGATSIKMSK